MDQLGRTQYPTTAAISPDGNYVAWSLMTANGAELHLTRLAKVSAQDRVISPDTVADKTNTHAGICTGGLARLVSGREAAGLSVGLL